ncbi:HIT family protein [Candidatus Woesearchaeota archaeon]|nr:HIT family protein [Candidatus Woesearchaeota archaeon]
MTECPYCSFKGDRIFDDDLVSAVLPEHPAVPGHVMVIPKRHIQILEQSPEDVVTALFDAANRISVALFEGLKAQGTNIVLMNGLAAGQKVPHLSVHVLPRVKDDGLNFSWPTRKLSDDQMMLIESQIREQAFDLGLPAVGSGKEENHVEEERPRLDIPKKSGKPDYFLDNLNRMP